MGSVEEFWIIVVEWRALLWVPIVAEGLAWLLFLAWVITAKRIRLAAAVAVFMAIARPHNVPED
jgi:hypothetical protein